LIVDIEDKGQDFESVEWNSKRLFHFKNSSISCFVELLFSEMNFIKSDLRKWQTDECSAACTLLKVTNYKPNINEWGHQVSNNKNHIKINN